MKAKAFQMFLSTQMTDGRPPTGLENKKATLHQAVKKLKIFIVYKN